MKPTYPELLKAFIFSQKEKPIKKQSDYVNEIVQRLKKSEDWKDYETS